MTANAALQEASITPDIVAEHGLTPDEYERVLDIMEREPNLVELGIFSVMWSEHCSYKSTRRHLKKLHTTGEQVICGPGENAGVIDIGDGQAAIFKMESHNHPSFIEPYQGAATGVGGILRDVFTMGARPVAIVNALRFGDTKNSNVKRLMGGVVSGIAGYGNCMGIPTVAGECDFHKSYNSNNLTNAMAVGLADADKIFYSAAAAVGAPVLYAGAKTGRDGIHGATMASAEFDENSEEKRPTVQVGDPFTEKRVMEACLELMQEDAIMAIQDMGAAGLTCSSFEMADKGGTGVALNLDLVPQREPNMSAYDILLSESQERMLMVIKPGREDVAKRIFDKWEVDNAVVGEITDSKRMVISHHGQVVADMPISPLSDEAPIYDRPWKPTAKYEEPLDIERETTPRELLSILKKLIATPDLASKRWIWEQYDHMVMGDTVARPGGDAALVRVHGTKKALAVSSDCTPRYVVTDPVEGGKQAVAESYRNISATGATPLAITNCLNFGNPEKPEVMGQIVGALKGMTEACEALNYPVVSGNASLYNETDGAGILPTPTIGGVGLIADYEKAVTIPFKNEGDCIIRIGEMEGHLGASLYLRETVGREKTPPPPVDLELEKTHGEFIRFCVEQGWLTASHDVSDGGQLVAIAEMAMASGLGANLIVANDIGRAFGEDQGRYIITVPQELAERVLTRAPEMGVTATVIGEVTGDELMIEDASVKVAELREANEATIPALMA